MAETKAQTVTETVREGKTIIEPDPKAPREPSQAEVKGGKEKGAGK